MAAGEQQEQQDLRHYVRVVSRRKWTVAFATLMVVGTALLMSLLQTPMYEATAEVLLRPSPEEGALLAEQGREDAARTLPTEIQLIQSKPVRDRVRQEIGVAPLVQVRQVGGTEFLAIRAEHSEPADAAE